MYVCTDPTNTALRVERDGDRLPATWDWRGWCLNGQTGLTGRRSKDWIPFKVKNRQHQAFERVRNAMR